MNLEDIISGWNGCVCSGDGPSDLFSIATLTISNYAPGTGPILLIPVIYPNEGLIIVGSMLQNGSYYVPLYNGKSVGGLINLSDGVMSGDATADGTALTITGDFFIAKEVDPK